MSLFALLGGVLSSGAESSSDGASGGLFAGVAGGAINQATGAASQVLSQGIGAITGIFSGLLSGPTGAAGVEFINDANPTQTGLPYWHNKRLTAKWRVMDAFFKQYNGGQGLESFGWDLNKVPSSASARFKGAENRFFEIVELYAKDVANNVLPQELFLDQAPFNDRVAMLRATSNGGVVIDLGNGSGSNSSGGNANITTGNSNIAEIATYVGVGLTLLSMFKRR